jgi:hypothetical protein
MGRRSRGRCHLAISGSSSTFARYTLPTLDKRVTGAMARLTCGTIRTLLRSPTTRSWVHDVAIRTGNDLALRIATYMTPGWLCRSYAAALRYRISIESSPSCISCAKSLCYIVQVVVRIVTPGAVSSRRLSDCRDGDGLPDRGNPLWR